MSRASVNKNISVNGHKTRAEFLGPKVCKLHYGFPSNFLEILEYKGNLQTNSKCDKKTEVKGGKSLAPGFLMIWTVFFCPLLNRNFELIIKKGDKLLRNTVSI